MALRDDLYRALTPLTGAGLSTSQPHTLTLAFPGGEFETRLVGVDSIGCSFLSLGCRSDRLARATIDELKRTSERLAERINYLLEPICPIEVDPDQCVVQLRSTPPQKDDDGSRYYELLARREGLTLTRWNQPRGAARQVIPADVTREVLLRLAVDFAALA